MSRLHRGVIRTARLLPEVVKIGVAPEPEKPELPDEQFDDDEASPELEPVSEPDSGEQIPDAGAEGPDEILLGGGGDEHHAADEPDAELLAKIDELSSRIADLEAANAEISAAKAKLEADIDGVKSDYESKKKAIEADAADMAAKAEAEARDRGYAEGRDSGYSDGSETARKEIQAEYRDKFAALASLLENIGARIDDDFTNLVSLNRQRMLRLWSVMLGRMLNAGVELDRDNVLNVLSGILSRLSDKNKIVLYVSPDDVKIINDGMKGEFQEVVRGVRHLEVKPDVNVDKGSCIVETDLGVYDARWRTQMEQIDIALDNIFQADRNHNAEHSEDAATANDSEAQP